jgi:hypothetical protein
MLKDDTHPNDAAHRTSPYDLLLDLQSLDIHLDLFPVVCIQRNSKRPRFLVVGRRQQACG